VASTDPEIGFARCAVNADRSMGISPTGSDLGDAPHEVLTNGLSPSLGGADSKVWVALGGGGTG
jgi:hypothetical protein